MSLVGVETQPHFLFLLLPLRYYVTIKVENGQTFFRSSEISPTHDMSRGRMVLPLRLIWCIAARSSAAPAADSGLGVSGCVLFYCGGVRGETSGRGN